MSSSIGLIVVNGHAGAVEGGSGAPPTEVATGVDGVRVVDLRTPSASVHSTVRTTLEAVPPLLAGVDERSSVLVVLVWPSPERTEVVVPPRRRMRRTEGPVAWRAVGPEGEGSDDPAAAAWFDHIYRPEAGWNELLLSAALMGAWLDRQGCRSVQALHHADSLPADWEERFPDLAVVVHDRWLAGGRAGWRASAVDGTDMTALVAQAALAPREGRPAAMRVPRPHSPFSLSGVDLLVVNGDSNTYGEELADPAGSGWPAILAAELGVPLVNLASRGASNHRILRTSVEHLPAVCQRHGVPAERTMFVGLWSVPNRYERVGDKPTKAFVHYEHFSDRNWHRLGTWLLDRDEASEAWLRHLHTTDSGVADLLIWTVLLSAWLVERGHPHALGLAYPLVPADAHRRHVGLFPLVDERHLVGGMGGWSEASLHASVAPAGQPRLDGRHPDATEHRRYVAERLLPHLGLPSGATGR